MRKKHNIFWVEEETEKSLAELRGYLESSLMFKLDIAKTYQEAELKVNLNDDFSIIIIDIRIPKGNTSIEKLSHQSIHYNQYGLDLIEFIHKNKPYLLNKILIYTNESWDDIAERLDLVGLIREESFLQKRECRGNKHFESIVMKVINKDGSTI
jgi:DNA-binding NarL/FixJ family response regulator